MDKSPDAFRTISEAAEELDLPQHVLRFWETRFNQIRPLKRGGGRRYYRPDDVQLLKGIRHLLYDQGFTIKGVQRILKEQGAKHVIAIGDTGSIVPIAPQSPDDVVVPDHDYEDIDDLTALPAPERHTETLHGETAGLSAEQRDRLNTALELLEDCQALISRARG
ncbi:MerR family transcriptional regulator [Pelagibacterium luteolum]|uniref:MerR HTH family regulatory protein n=1 Tax=Pelagibacterium luteolum TaxID=440168 RepID=A0A1G7WFB7_9HYPH|nr:MerR family transcriptional regulator [Pelagibacterium luteolum]SDG70673.1 MerR HTH family regulatory protein [Pelagibacterium luteolum]